jgi:hypothetical protein
MTRPLEWMAAIRDHPDRPSAKEAHVLGLLALRLDWKTGTGYVSIEQLATDAGVARSTVQRAIKWARGNPVDERFFLARLKRGHRLGHGGAMASVWLLRLPSQPVSSELLSESQPVSSELLTATSTGQNGSLNRSKRRSQQVTAELPSRPGSSRPGASSAALARDDARGAAPKSSAGEDYCRCGVRLRDVVIELKPGDFEPIDGCGWCHRLPEHCDCFPFGDLVGSLVLIWVQSRGFIGDDLVVRADVHALDGPARGELARDAFVYGDLGRLLAPAVDGDPLLGRVVRAGGDFDLQPGTAAEVELATAYIRQLRPGAA